jgi:hypothetical protein
LPGEILEVAMALAAVTLEDKTSSIRRAFI